MTQKNDTLSIAYEKVAAKLYPRILRHDFSSFIAQSFSTVDPASRYLPNWHIDAIGEYLEATRRSEITRLIINMPPRSLKSVCVSVAWPAWLLGNDPSMRVMASSYSQALSVKHALDTRLLVTSAWYQKVFPEFCIERGQNERHKFVTTRRGFRFATSTGGTATGEGGDVLIVDDPLNPLQANSKVERDQANIWFDQTFSTRLNDKEKGRIVVVMQRLHAEDLSGHLLAKGGWEHLCLPACAERKTIVEMGGFYHVRHAGEALHGARESLQLLERAKLDLGSFAYAAQYQQSPMLESGGMVEASWLKRYRSHEMPECFDAIIQSWDTAIKAGASNDASVCITVGEKEGEHYILDVLAIRAEYPELKRAVFKQVDAYCPDAILIEDKASGQSLLQDLRRETSLPVIARLPRRDKVTRMAAVTPMIEAGRVLFPKHAAWLAEFEQELLSFPNAPHDDMVDALSQYLGWVREKAGVHNAMRMRWL